MGLQIIKELWNSHTKEKHIFTSFMATLKDLPFNLKQRVWVDGTLLINYTTKERCSVACSILEKAYFEKKPS